MRITDLPDLELARYVDGQILIDYNAAGHGWFIDRTPGDDREYTDDGVLLVARNGSAAGMDLLSVIEHELGHAAGAGHDDEGLMSESLAAGTRIADPVLPLFGAVGPSSPAAEGAVLPSIDWTASFGVTNSVNAAAPGWQQDFVNHNGRTDVQRNPNAALKVQVELAPKLSGNLRAQSNT